MPDADKLTPADADLAKALAFRRGDAGELVLHEAEQEAIREMVALRAQGNPNSNEGPWPLTRQPDNSSGRAWSLSQYARGLRRDWQRRCHGELSTGRRGDAFSLAADPTCYPAFFRGAVFWGCFSTASFCAPPAIGNSSIAFRRSSISDLETKQSISIV